MGQQIWTPNSTGEPRSDTRDGVLSTPESCCRLLVLVLLIDASRVEHVEHVLTAWTLDCKSGLVTKNGKVGQTAEYVGPKLSKVINSVSLI